ncbi:uncharacterized protein F5147DRAFT_658337 [Suillus discolor]|uniref:Uncharacterized protein n=1 Tax=Suillus discolor TaxID=1912936 RepID=A0A9P7ET76_9AGAM|nr:uncharacterized protein F5147DRAFT_658337 [Suillus discolor]KAG2089737.1 hypothetical protein F5147DRAFT_658337 [Suillus discolor]
MTPADAANEALNETPAAVQLLMKQCMMLRQGDPEALKLSDEIARHVAKDLRLHAGIATSLSPQLLSCAAIVRDCSKGGIFQTSPDWTSVTDKDLRIKCHLQFNKTMDYHSCVAVKIPVLVETPTLSSSATSAPVSFTTPPVAAVSTPDLPPGDMNHARKPAAPAIELLPLSPSPFSKALEPLTPLPVSALIPLRYNLFVSGTNVMPKVGNGKKRRAEDDDPVEAKSVVPSPLITKEDLALACSDCSEGTDDRGFWDAETRPVEWGQDSAITTAVKMKISCAINGVGVRERMQAKAKAKAADDTCNTVRHSKSRAPKSRVVINTPVNTRSRKTLIPPALSSSEVEPDVIECRDSAPDAKPMCMDVSPVPTEVQPTPMMCPPAPIKAEAPWAVNPVEPEPTARDILQSIQDLGRWLDLLATNERVNELDARLSSVEDIFGRQLSALEQHLNSSDTEWRAMSASIGHLTIAIRDHKDDLTAHCSQINTTAYAPPTHANAHLPAWLAHSDEDPHISAIGRQWTHAWDVSIMTGVQGHVGTSASAALIAETLDSTVPAADISPEPFSDLSTISDD